jgi:catechol-2,3-dioxygenase
MHETEMPKVIGVGHVALSARDPSALAEFYSDVLGYLKQILGFIGSQTSRRFLLSLHSGVLLPRRKL